MHAPEAEMALSLFSLPSECCDVCTAQMRIALVIQSVRSFAKNTFNNKAKDESVNVIVHT